MLKRWHPLKAIIIATIVLIVMPPLTLGYIQKGLWMQQLGYTGVFSKLFFSRWGLSLAAFVVVFLHVWLDVRLAARNGASSDEGFSSDSTALAKLDIKISPPAFRLATLSRTSLPSLPSA